MVKSTRKRLLKNRRKTSGKRCNIKNQKTVCKKRNNYKTKKNRGGEKTLIKPKKHYKDAIEKYNNEISMLKSSDTYDENGDNYNNIIIKNREKLIENNKLILEELKKNKDEGKILIYSTNIANLENEYKDKNQAMFTEFSYDFDEKRKQIKKQEAELIQQEARIKEKEEEQKKEEQKKEEIRKQQAIQQTKIKKEEEDKKQEAIIKQQEEDRRKEKVITEIKGILEDIKINILENIKKYDENVINKDAIMNDKIVENMTKIRENIENITDNSIYDEVRREIETLLVDEFKKLCENIGILEPDDNTYKDINAYEKEAKEILKNKDIVNGRCIIWESFHEHLYKPIWGDYNFNTRNFAFKHGKYEKQVERYLRKDI
jgi:hypothetical protein